MTTTLTAAGTDGARVLHVLDRFTNVTPDEIALLGAFRTADPVYALLVRMRVTRLVERERDDCGQWRYILGPRAPQRQAREGLREGAA